MYGNKTNNILFSSSTSPLTSSSVSSPTPSITPSPLLYSQYWIRYKEPCPNKNSSYYQLNMKRKALTLQYNNSHTQIKKLNQYIKAVKNNNRITNRDNHNNQEIMSKCNRDISFSASQSDVPGDKSFILYDNPNTPVYNYIPVKRTYQGGNNKYPYTAWKYGMLGFPRGMKGTSREMRNAAQLELDNNPNKYSRSYSPTCNNKLCTNKIINEVNVNISSINTKIQLIDEDKTPININTSDNNNKQLHPIILNPKYTDIGNIGQIWCSQSDFIPSDKYYIYILTLQNNEWWYSISKLSPESIKSINQYANTDLKTLAYAMFTPYPFVEFKLNLKSLDNTKNNYTFSVLEIYFQTKIPNSTNNIIGAPTYNPVLDYRFLLDKRQDSEKYTKLYFTITNKYWVKGGFYEPIYKTTDKIKPTDPLFNNIGDIGSSQCLGSSPQRPCMPCGGAKGEQNCEPFPADSYYCVASVSGFTDSQYCPDNGVFSALTNTFWWRPQIIDNTNIFNYSNSNKFYDINNNQTISLKYNYDICFSSIELTINCRE